MNRITRITVAPDGEPMFSEMAINAEIEDEGAGEFISLSGSGESGKVFVNPCEWPEVCQAVNTLIRQIAKNEKNKK